MKYTIVIALSFALSACSLFSPKKAPEVVASCFSDGEDQTKMCKAQRVDDENRIVVTRCIGSHNREASPVVRGKCAEKICSEGSNTDCQVRGEMRVLEQYADLVTSNMFGDGESSSAPMTKKQLAKDRKARAKSAKALGLPATSSAAVAAPVAAAEVDTDPSVALPPSPERKVAAVEATPAPAPQKIVEEPAEAPQVAIALKPLKGAKRKAALAANARALAGIKPAATATAAAPAASSNSDDGFKKVCVAKNDASAPEILRGKCATRSCTPNGKCSYKGRKEMFDYVAKSE